MTDITFELPDDTEADEVELPAVLPVLPLKEMVVFPQSMTPLAIGQERSVRLIDDVVAGDRLLALVTAKDSSIESPDWDDIHEIGTGDRHLHLCACLCSRWKRVIEAADWQLRMGARGERRQPQERAAH